METYLNKNSHRKPFFSVIITVLNGNKYAKSCLEKMEEQTFKDFEIVIIDGGSKDGTVDSIMSSMLSNINLNIIPGVGLYAGLNAGIAVSKGTWLYFMGIDDEFFDKNVLQKINFHISNINHSYDVLVGNVYYPRRDFVFKPTLGSPYMIRHKVHHQGIFYKSKVFNDVRYNENYKISSDYELNLQLALKGVVHKYIDLTIAQIGEDGISNTQIENSSKEIHKIHGSIFSGVSKIWVINYFKVMRSILLFRHAHGLVNIKKRIKNTFFRRL